MFNGSVGTLRDIVDLRRCISRPNSRGILFEEPFNFKRLKASTTEMTAMRAIDQVKSLKQRPAYPPGGHSNIRSTSSSSQAPHHISSRHMRPCHRIVVRQCNSTHLLDPRGHHISIPSTALRRHTSTDLRARQTPGTSMRMIIDEGI